MVVHKLINFVCVRESLDQEVEYADLEPTVVRLSRPGAPGSGAAHLRRQALMREQGIVSMLLEALEIVIKCCDRAETQGDNPGSKASGPGMGGGRGGRALTPVQFWISMRRKLSTPSFWLLYISLHKSPANQASTRARARPAWDSTR